MSLPTRHWLVSLWQLAHPSRWPGIDPLEVVPRLLVIVLLLNVPPFWYLQVPLVVLGIAGLTLTTPLRSTAYWFTMAVALGAVVYFHWDTADNHQYLFVYACLALCASFSLPPAEQQAALVKSSGWLVGLCMLLATAWKLATPNYCDGSFFTYALLADSRFAEVARLAGDVPASQLAENHALQSLLTSGAPQGLTVNEVTLHTNSRIAALAQWLTWWTIAIEGLLAALFLLPLSRRAARFRHLALLVFGLTTYSVAPVRGFGWMLMVLGIANCNDGENRWRWGYLAAILAIQCYLAPLWSWW